MVVLILLNIQTASDLCQIITLGHEKISRYISLMSLIQ